MADRSGATAVERLAAFIERASFDDASPEARKQLKLHVLDALGCGIGALDAGPMRAVREHTEELGGNGSNGLSAARKARSAARNDGRGCSPTSPPWSSRTGT